MLYRNLGDLQNGHEVRETGITCFVFSARPFLYSVITLHGSVFVCWVVVGHCHRYTVVVTLLVFRPGWVDGKKPEKIITPRYDGLNSYKSDFY